MGEIDWPFIGTEALAAGAISRRSLCRNFEALYRNVFVPRNVELTAAKRAEAAWLWSNRQATLGGLSAAAVHGSQWIDAALPAELYRIGDRTDGIVIRRGKLRDDEICIVDGLPVTTAARTLYDIGRQPGLTKAVIRCDALARVTSLQCGDARAIADRNRGAREIIQLRRVLDLMDSGAESPQETRTRLVLVEAGLPRQQTQIVIRDRFGYPFARLDMGWERWKVGVEYDGAQHWTDPRQRTHDIDRYAEVEALGWRLVRVNGDILRYRPAVIVDRARAALRAAGWRGDLRPLRPRSAC